MYLQDTEHRPGKGFYFCNGCNVSPALSQALFGCRACDYDLCKNCYVDEQTGTKGGHRHHSEPPSNSSPRNRTATRQRKQREEAQEEEREAQKKKRGPRADATEAVEGWAERPVEENEDEPNAVPDLIGEQFSNDRSDAKKVEGRDLSRPVLATPVQNHPKLKELMAMLDAEEMGVLRDIAGMWHGSDTEVVRKALRDDPSILETLRNGHKDALRRSRDGDQRKATRSRSDRNRNTRGTERDEQRGFDLRRRTRPICWDFKRGGCWRRDCKFLHIK
jgi:hypothetical protein